MTTFQALVLGIIQGLSEFLPISSSAHLTLAPWLFNWPDPGLSFDVALHLGTLIAVLWYFRAEWAKLVRALGGLLATRRADTVEKRRVVFLIIATIPGAIGGFLLEKPAETAFRSPALIATMLIVMGVVLWLVDRVCSAERPLSGMKWLDAILIGIAQVVALVPGVSRSGGTITAGRALRFDRESAATFSFLMSMPIIAGAAILKVPGVIRESGFSTPLIVGVIASALSGWLAISIVMRYVTRHSYGIFAAYRVALGVIVLLVIYLRG
jgi:undecaprenyl-diphosphatase